MTSPDRPGRPSQVPVPSSSRGESARLSRAAQHRAVMSLAAGSGSSHSARTCTLEAGARWPDGWARWGGRARRPRHDGDRGDSRRRTRARRARGAKRGDHLDRRVRCAGPRGPLGAHAADTVLRLRQLVCWGTVKQLSIEANRPGSLFFPRLGRRGHRALLPGTSGVGLWTRSAPHVGLSTASCRFSTSTRPRCTPTSAGMGRARQDAQRVAVARRVSADVARGGSGPAPQPARTV